MRTREVLSCEANARWKRRVSNLDTVHADAKRIYRVKRMRNENDLNTHPFILNAWRWIFFQICTSIIPFKRVLNLLFPDGIFLNLLFPDGISLKVDSPTLSRDCEDTALRSFNLSIDGFALRSIINWQSSAIKRLVSWLSFFSLLQHYIASDCVGIKGGAY
jgi:hypothetical protein